MGKFITQQKVGAWEKGTWELGVSLQLLRKSKKKKFQDFPGGPVVRGRPANARYMGSVPVPGRANSPLGN